MDLSSNNLANGLKNDGIVRGAVVSAMNSALFEDLTNRDDGILVELGEVGAIDLEIDDDTLSCHAILVPHPGTEPYECQLIDTEGDMILSYYMNSMTISIYYDGLLKKLESREGV